MDELKNIDRVGYHRSLPAIPYSGVIMASGVWNLGGWGSGQLFYSLDDDPPVDPNITVATIDREKCEYCGRSSPEWFVLKEGHCKHCGGDIK